ncbi:hypothetical protein MRB53_029796 [Persea americana]|uniref:Uncharacterized protein n=1 Tax=Persea americana TaxID=3435 RepID=A0ACC2KJB3_PERAE|nr:hypothetical protein MRB53_029796 [Persea americana]
MNKNKNKDFRKKRRESRRTESLVFNSGLHQSLFSASFPSQIPQLLAKLKPIFFSTTRKRKDEILESKKFEHILNLVEIWLWSYQPRQTWTVEGLIRGTSIIQPSYGTLGVAFSLLRNT